MYKIRIILDAKEDVIRTILVEQTINLEMLHFAITKAFGFGGQEMASFYRTDEEWIQGEEIPLFDMAEIGVDTSMASHTLEDTLIAENEKLIYVYDFMKMWTFYVELLEIIDEKLPELPAVILSVGEIPSEAPEKEFIAEKNDAFEFDGDEDLDNGFDDFPDEFDYN